MPRGYPNSGLGNGLGPSGNTKRLIEAMRELEERIAVEKTKDRARALLLQFAQKHGLSAIDLRNAAKVLADRKVSGEPIYSKNSKRTASGQPGVIKMHALGAPKGKIGKAIRKARLSAKLSDSAVGDLLGCHSSSVGSWQRGKPVPARFHDKLTEVLKLPKGIFPAAPALTNGHAAH